jgi:inward rectifier potassium channel
MAKTRDPGLGTKFSEPVKRLLNPDGSYNITRKGGIRGFRDFYKYLLDKSWRDFIALLVITYISINLIFALVYLMIGVDQLSSVNSSYHSFWTAFFFSSQTLTTLGFGYIAPVGFLANIAATIEAFIGLTLAAFSTGLVYGRFSKPILKLAFSENAIITPFQDGHALMIKLVNQRDNVLLKSKINCTLTLDKGIGIDSYNKEFHQLKLELDNILFFPLTWTIVHKIDEKSPLWGISFDELMKRNVELIVLFETYDETFGQNVFQKHSYAGNQWRENVKFDSNFKPNSKGHLELDVHRINTLIELDNT